jgi:hypothetical protein
MAWAPIAAAAVAATSAVFQGIATNQKLDADRSALDREEEYLEKQREFLLETRDEEIDLFREETSELLGLQEVGYARSGFDLSGSVTTVLSRTLLEAKEEETRIYRQYEREREMSYERTKDIYGRKSAISSAQGMLPISTLLGAGASGVSGYVGGTKLKKAYG